jgi:hypothetical protein
MDAKLKRSNDLASDVKRKQKVITDKTAECNNYKE